MSGIIWLASYPKSGNTWMRIFLTNYLRNADQPADINDLDGGPIASARELFDDWVGVEASDLIYPEILRLRSEVYLHYAQKLTENEFLKVHDSYIFTADGKPLFPPEASFGAVYVVRNPLAVAPSLANHSNITIDQAIDAMGGRHEVSEIHEIGLADQLGQRWLTWSQHVMSWVEAPGQRVLVVRYEDMKRIALRVFKAVVCFAGLEYDETRLRKAVEFSSFENVKKQEQERGFRERAAASVFFRKGQIASWRHELTQPQIDRLVKDHFDVMRRFGYLSETGEPLDIPLELEMASYG